MKIRPCLFFLKKGLVSSIIFFLLGTYNQVPLYYIGLFLSIIIVIVVFVYYFLKLLYKRETGLHKCFRFGFIIKREFWTLFKRYGLLLSLILIVGIELTCIPWKYLRVMLFVLSFSLYLNYISAIAFYNLFRKSKDGGKMIENNRKR